MNIKMKKLPLAVVQAFGAGVVVSLAATTVQAQQPQKVEKIEVTGSNIKRVDAEGPLPIQIITREEIARSGQTTVGEVLRNLPLNSSASYDDTFTGSFARGSSGVSLRGLGQRATLTLINGRRMASFGFAQNLQDVFVDLNSIPLAAIERIEVLKDGASAIYGSDAIAGVVNIILRKDFTGIDGTAMAGTTSHNDGNEKRLSVAGGWGDVGRDRYNAIAVIDYFKRNIIWARDRTFSSSLDQRQFQGGTDLRSTISNPGNYARVTGTPFPTTRLPFSSCPTDRRVSVGGVINCVEDTNVYLTLIPETERLGSYGRLTYDFTPSLSAFVEAGYNDTKTFTQSAPFGVPSTQIGPTLTRQINARLPVGNPSNPYSVPVDVRYRFDDVGPRQIDNETKAKRVVAGFKGTAGAWDWEAGAVYANSFTTQDDHNGIKVSGLLSVIADGSYNFLNPSANSQATYDRLKAEYQRRGDSTMKQVDAKATSDLYQLPAGPLAVAVGMERRRESLHDNADDVLVSGDVLGRGSSRANGSRDLTSGYAEFSIPLLKNLEMQLAARTDRYSDFGSSSTPKVALRWNANPAILVRASFAKGFRAPNLVEIGNSSAFFFTNVRDTLRCSINSFYCPTTSTAGSFAGNAQLKPEKSDSKSLGLVFEPGKDFNIGFDYYNIKQKHVVGTESFQAIINREPTDPAYAARVIRGPASADDIARGAPGSLLIINAQFLNLTELTTSGVDVDLRWKFAKNETGTYTLSSTNTYVSSYKTQDLAGGPLIEFAGTYGVPRWRSVSTFAWESGPWYAGLTYNHTSAYAQSSSAPPGVADEVGNWDTVDVQGSYSAFKNLKLTLGVRNIDDKQPPTDLSSGAVPYDFSQSNPRGRFFYGSVNFQFK